MAPDSVVPLLTWMIVAVGGALLGVLLWIWRRVQKHVDELPERVSAQVGKVHAELVEQMKEMNATHSKLEHDLREQFTQLDRRVVRLEVLKEVAK